MPAPKRYKSGRDHQREALAEPPEDGTRRKRLKLTQDVVDLVSPALAATLDTVWDQEVKPLHIKIRKGVCTWAYRARVGLDQKQTDIIIGDVRRVSVKQARDLVDVIRPIVKRKEDPRPAVFAVVNGGPKAEPPAPVTGWRFGDMCDRYVARKLDISGTRSHQEYKSAFRREELKPLRDRPAAEISRADMAAVRDGIVAATSPGRAIKVLRYISEMYQWAVGEPAAGLPEAYNPTRGINLPRTTEEERESEGAEETDNAGRFLSPEELAVAFQAIAATKMHFGVRMALLFALASGQRRGAIVQAEVSQIRHSDERGWYWFAPARIMKARVEHVVPLPPLLRRLVDVSQRHAARCHSKWLFPSERRAYRGETRDAHVNEGALNGVVTRMLAPDPAKSPPAARGSKKRQQNKRQGMLDAFGMEEWSTHDTRRTMTTNLVPMGVQEWHVSLLLAHSISDTEHSRSRVTRKHYNCYKYYAEKRAVAEKWCIVLEQCGFTTAYLEAVEAAELAAWECRMGRRARHDKGAEAGIAPEAAIA